MQIVPDFTYTCIWSHIKKDYSLKLVCVVWLRKYRLYFHRSTFGMHIKIAIVKIKNTMYKKLQLKTFLVLIIW